MSKDAAPDAGLPDRIMAAIARANSKRPACAADVCALLPVSEAEFWSALEGLLRTGRIHTAHIQRPATDTAPWLAIWPSGIVLPRTGWTSAHLSSLFVPHDTTACKRAHAPRSRGVA